MTAKDIFIQNSYKIKKTDISTDYFYSKFKYPILMYLLKDEDIGLSLYLKDNRVIKNEKSSYTNNEELFFTKYTFEYWFEKGFNYDFLIGKNILTEIELDFIIANQKYKTQPSNTQFSRISNWKCVLWSDKILDKYKEYWNWHDLAKNVSIKWDSSRIQKFDKYVSFKQLSYNTNIYIDEYTLNKYQDFWDWNGISGNPKIAKDLENVLLNHPHAIWVNKPINNGTYFSNKNDQFVENIKWDVFDENYKYWVFDSCWNIKPCICTNPNIKWSLPKVIKHKTNIDLWLLTIFAEIEDTVIYEYSEELNECRPWKYCFVKESDWYDSYTDYRTGWHNLVYNTKFIVDFNFLLYLSTIECDYIYSEGSARGGYKEVIGKFNPLLLLSTYSLKLTFHELTCCVDILRMKLTEKSMGKGIYINVLKEHFHNERNLDDFLQILLKSEFSGL